MIAVWGDSFLRMSAEHHSMGAIDSETVRDALERYPQHAVFARVEDDRLETLPDAFRDGSYLWKDVEWVVRWYCRRPLDGHDRSAEEAFRENGMDEIRDAIDTVHAADTIHERVDALVALDGVTVPIASAFLQFIDPDSFAVIDRRAWRTLHQSGAVDAPYPDPVSMEAYEQFLRECHGIAATADVRVAMVARALWVLDVDRNSPAELGRHR